LLGRLEISQKRYRSLDFVYPELKDSVLKVLDDLKDKIPGIAVFESLRMAKRQDYLYSLGRELPGNIVTEAKGWESWHQYGLAVDFAVLKDKQWSWDFDTRLLRYSLRSHNLETISWEASHAQLTRGLSIKEAKEIHLTKSFTGVWAKVEERK